jgi:hypothetical protein
VSYQLQGEFGKGGKHQIIGDFQIKNGVEAGWAKVG